jgi:hypothetical protein
MTGWKTAEVSKNEVPDQNASIAVPFSFSVMIGSAMLKYVASSAAARVITHIDVKASRKPLDGVKAGVTLSIGCMSALSLSAWKPPLSKEDGISVVFSAVKGSSKLEADMAGNLNPTLMAKMQIGNTCRDKPQKMGKVSIYLLLVDRGLKDEKLNYPQSSGPCPLYKYKPEQQKA